MLIVFDPNENDDENDENADGSESGDNRRLSIRLPTRLVDGARVTPIDRPRVGFFHRIRPSVRPSLGGRFSRALL